ncbi:hypothetical protein DENSPDRAFT_174539 [Dentipellis sp. KUC8613]|nr:hypothetical protein DENSPDRAFT_174539 [Dentipellis sp. KUC8613]
MVRRFRSPGRRLRLLIPRHIGCAIGISSSDAISERDQQHAQARDSEGGTSVTGDSTNAMSLGPQLCAISRLCVSWAVYISRAGPRCICCMCRRWCDLTNLLGHCRRGLCKYWLSAGSDALNIRASLMLLVAGLVRCREDGVCMRYSVSGIDYSWAPSSERFLEDRRGGAGAGDRHTYIMHGSFEVTTSGTSSRGRSVLRIPTDGDRVVIGVYGFGTNLTGVHVMRFCGFQAWSFEDTYTWYLTLDLMTQDIWIPDADADVYGCVAIRPFSLGDTTLICSRRTSFRIGRTRVLSLQHLT